MTDFRPKKVHGFPVRTPICHIAPISRIYGGGGYFTFAIEVKRGSSLPKTVCLKPSGLRFPLLLVGMGGCDLMGRASIGARKINVIFCCGKFFDNPSGHGRPRRKSWTSAPKSAFSCGPGGGEKLFDPWASARKGQECPREIRTKKFMFMLFFSSLT